MFRKAQIIFLATVWACMPLAVSAQFNGDPGFKPGPGSDGRPGPGFNGGDFNNGGPRGGDMRNGGGQPRMMDKGPRGGGPNGGPNGGMMGDIEGKCYKKYSSKMKQDEDTDQSANDDAIQKCIDDARLKQMKKDISPMTQGISMMKKQVASFSKTGGKCGIKLPEELTTGLISADGLLAKAKGATSMDEMQDIMGDMMDLGETMREWGPKIGMFGGMCQMLKEADNRIKQINKDITKLDKKKNKDDFEDQLKQYRTAAESLQVVLTGVKDTLKTDVEAAMDSLQNDFFGDMDSLDNIQQQIHMIIDVSQGIKQGRQEYARFKSQIADLKRKRNDVKDLETALGEFKQAMDDVGQYAKKKEFDELQTSIEAAFGKREEIMQGIEEMRGTNDFTPQLNRQQKGQGDFNFNVPKSFQRQAEDSQQGDSEQ